MRMREVIPFRGKLAGDYRKCTEGPPACPSYSSTEGSTPTLMKLGLAAEWYTRWVAFV
jgi:hypothetical protein